MVEQSSARKSKKEQARASKSKQEQAISTVLKDVLLSEQCNEEHYAYAPKKSSFCIFLNSKHQISSDGRWDINGSSMHDIKHIANLIYAYL